MVSDLSLPVSVIGIATQRAESGLALSSRNGYLSADERTQAAIIYRTLNAMATQVSAGQQLTEIETAGKYALTQAGLKLDYLTIRRQSDLQTATANDKELVILVAVYLGTTRLIDNLEVSL